MIETSQPSYYQKNKVKYQRGGKYYKYKPVEVTKPKIPLTVRKGKFIISFD
tara:strand:- start:970 stop:1122 length:153 start_codon:yes stop_codon:yes gene_type:complete